ncbi:MAG TPA: polymer-forming cytoskeletal protein [Sphingobacteriaceae bacterium]
MIRWITGRKREQDKDDEVIVNGHDHISRGSIRVDRDASGNFYALNRVVISGAARVTGNITASTAEIMGHVSGDILCSSAVMVRKTAVISGSIRAELMEVEAGAIINATVSVGEQVQVGSLLEKVNKAARESAEPVDRGEGSNDIPQPPRPPLVAGSSPRKDDGQTSPAVTPDSEGWW